MDNKRELTEDEAVVMFFALLISIIPLTGYELYSLDWDGTPLRVNILLMIFCFPITYLAACIPATVISTCYLIGKDLVGFWKEKKSAEKNEKLCARKAQLREQLTAVATDGPVNHRRIRIDPSYLDDPSRLESFADQEADPVIRNTLQEYRQVCEQLQTP